MKPEADTKSDAAKRSPVETPRLMPSPSWRQSTTEARSQLSVSPSLFLGAKQAQLGHFSPAGESEKLRHKKAQHEQWKPPTRRYTQFTRISRPVLLCCRQPWARQARWRFKKNW